jgi:predicted transcriptional regulator
LFSDFFKKAVNFDNSDTLLMDLSQSTGEFLHLDSVSDQPQHQQQHSPKRRSKKPITVSQNATLEEALDLICEKKVHRLFVVDSSFKPTAVISLGDLISKFKQ